MYGQARANVNAFNQQFDEEGQADYPDRDVNFEGLEILEDSRNVNYTYVPKDQVKTDVD